MFKTKKNRFLSTAVVMSLLFSNIYPLATVYAAELATPAAPEMPTLPAGSNDARTTDADKAIKDRVENSGDEDENSNGKKSSGNDSLAKLNTQTAEKARADYKTQQQENSTSKVSVGSFYVQDANGNLVTVTKNTCYQSSDNRCATQTTLSYKNGENTSYMTVPLNSIEYLTSNNSQLTPDMLNQVREQEKLTQNKDAIIEGNATGNAQGAMQAISQAVANGMSAADAMWMGITAQTNAKFNQQTLEDSKNFQDAMADVTAAKNKVANNLGEDAQLKRGTLKGGHTKRFDVVLNPTIPTVNMSQDVKATLRTNSGEINNEKRYTIQATVQNQKTGAEETFDVLENTPFVVEKAAWTTNPGTRTVTIRYYVNGVAKPEVYRFSYTVGNIVTGIIANGKTVSNSVIGLLNVADESNFNATTYPVAGRILDAEFIDGKCYVKVTDSKTSNDKPSAIVATDKIESTMCNMESLKGQYLSSPKVQARFLSDGSYVFDDVSNIETSAMLLSESDYDTLEDLNAKETQDKNDKWGSTTVYEKDGKILEGLPGAYGKDWTIIKGVPVAIYDGSKIAKPTGEDYSAEELNALGINPKNLEVSRDENGTVVVKDKNSGNVINSNNIKDVNVAAAGMQVVYQKQTDSIENISQTNQKTSFGKSGFLNTNSRKDKTSSSEFKIVEPVMSMVDTSIKKVILKTGVISSNSIGGSIASMVGAKNSAKKDALSELLTPVDELMRAHGINPKSNEDNTQYYINKIKEKYNND